MCSLQKSLVQDHEISPIYRRIMNRFKQIQTEKLLYHQAQEIASSLFFYLWVRCDGVGDRAMGGGIISGIREGVSSIWEVQSILFRLFSRAGAEVVSSISPSALLWICGAAVSLVGGAAGWDIAELYIESPRGLEVSKQSGRMTM